MPPPGGFITALDLALVVVLAAILGFGVWMLWLLDREERDVR